MVHYYFEGVQVEIGAGIRKELKLSCSLYSLFQSSCQQFSFLNIIIGGEKKLKYELRICV